MSLKTIRVAALGVALVSASVVVAACSDSTAQGTG